jgi:hypothetical protein
MFLISTLNTNWGLKVPQYANRPSREMLMSLMAGSSSLHGVIFNMGLVLPIEYTSMSPGLSKPAKQPAVVDPLSSQNATIVSPDPFSLFLEAACLKDTELLVVPNCRQKVAAGGVKIHARPNSLSPIEMELHFLVNPHSRTFELDQGTVNGKSEELG